MCGINGLIINKQVSEIELNNKINSMNDLIIHRGPDDDGIFSISKTEFSLAMGMRRLSIIDLSTGKQPIYSDDRSIVIVFNGEIYNYQSLRDDLINQGYTFKTHSDTEVILKLYQCEGTEGFKKLDGMFAFSIYDANKEKIFIARDFFGEKPLYYTEQQGKFIWASELKSIVKQLPLTPEIDRLGLNLYFKLTYIPSPHTIYQNIFKLEPNHFLTYDLKKHEVINLPIENPEPRLKNNIPFEEAKLKVRSLVQESVESRSVSDVPIGTFLSGGVDSSVVSLCLSKLKSDQINTFSIGFKNKAYDESNKAKTVANLIKSKHHEFIIDEHDLENHVHTILNNFDEPFADSSALPSYLVANKTSQYVKVALTGDGGDEVFGGYNKYYMGKINRSYTKMMPKSIHNLCLNATNSLLKTKNDKRGKRFKLNRLLKAVDYSNNYYWDIISLGFPSNTLASYLKPEHIITDPFQYYKTQMGINNPKNLTDYRAIDQKISLEGDMLVKVDRTSMLSSLECRAPFLNKKIWQYTNSLPEDYLMKGWNKKYILKEAFKEDFPTDFLNKSKSGFGVPVGDWLRSLLRKELESYIEPTFLKEQNIFQIEAITKLVNNHLNGKDHTFMVWSFYCFQKWYEKNYIVN